MGYFNRLSLKDGEPPCEMSRAFIIMLRNLDGGYPTLNKLMVCDDNGIMHNVGVVKIANLKMKKNERRRFLPPNFDVLDQNFFSVGLNEQYYENLDNLGEETRLKILTGLRDIALNKKIFQDVLDEDITTSSILKLIDKNTVTGQFHRMAHGGARVEKFKFQHTIKSSLYIFQKPVVLKFEVDPNSKAPTNLHAIIGSNGSGKTTLLKEMAESIINQESVFSSRRKSKSAAHTIDNLFAEYEDKNVFAGLVSVSFSAFDSFFPLKATPYRRKGIRYAYIGLMRQKRAGEKSNSLKNLNYLIREFNKSARNCAINGKSNLLAEILKILENADPIFKNEEISKIVPNFGENQYNSNLEIYRKLSAGHKIILLTIARLVETVNERTLVLFDEPESHLHPPLLSALMQALSYLLLHRNGVAVLATHSPIVLQEIPAECVWVLSRDEDIITAKRPKINTYGENIGILTREIFGLNVMKTGVNKIIIDSVKEIGYKKTIEVFGKDLGVEGKALALATSVNRSPKKKGKNE